MVRPMSEDNRVVNGLWIGSGLSMLELLTIQSFLDHGHHFRLWCYDKIDTDLPNGVEIMDANEIIPQHRVFRYRKKNQFGHGKGSVSGFSDIFRYKLLHDNGGWWVDMDVTCIKPLDFEAPYYFRQHQALPLVGNVMKSPKGCKLMSRCYHDAFSCIDENNTDWHKPINILAENVSLLNLEKHIATHHSTVDNWETVRKYLFTEEPLPDHWFFIHWMNEEWRTRMLEKHDFRIGSAYANKLIEHGLVQDDFTQYGKWKNNIRFGIKRILD